VQVVEKKSTTRILPGSGAVGTVPLLTGCNEKLGAAEPALRLNEHANCFGANQTQYQADPTKSTTIKAIATSTCLRQNLRKNRPIVPVSAQSRRFGHNAGIFCRTSELNNAANGAIRRTAKIQSCLFGQAQLRQQKRALRRLCK